MFISHNQAAPSTSRAALSLSALAEKREKLTELFGVDERDKFLTEEDIDKILNQCINITETFIDSITKIINPESSSQESNLETLEPISHQNLESILGANSPQIEFNEPQTPFCLSPNVDRFTSSPKPPENSEPTLSIKKNKYKCIFGKCEKLFNKRCELIYHIRRHIGVKNFLCDICGKSFADKSNLTRHRKVHSHERPFNCAICDKNYKHKKNLIIHQKSHFTIDSSESECNSPIQSTTNKSSEKFKSTPQQDSNKKYFNCTQCEKNFSRLEGLNKHLRIHSGEKPYSCSICNKEFIQPAHLTRHLKIHSDEKPFTCTTCNQSFKQAEYLKQHQKVHAPERIHICQICNKSFTKSEKLINHQQYHNKEKPYSCNLCDKSFFKTKELVRHKRIHSGEKPFSCELCNKNFRVKSCLERHKNSVHKQK